jgi:hypothetical protein
MSSIGGPGGIGGPKGPTGPTGPGEIDDVADAQDVSDVSGVDAAQASKAAGQLEAMAADIAAGKLTANEAIDRLVSEIAGSDQLGATEQSELKEMLVDLVANDPYLQSLVGRL